MFGLMCVDLIRYLYIHLMDMFVCVCIYVKLLSTR